jgi:hypothetical protein
MFKTIVLVYCQAILAWLVGELGDTPNRPRPFHAIRGLEVAEHSTIVLKIHVQQRFWSLLQV